jgi:hypothetical protein
MTTSASKTPERDQDRTLPASGQDERQPAQRTPRNAEKRERDDKHDADDKMDDVIRKTPL